MKETLDFIKESEQIDLLNEGTVSLHVPRVCRVIRLKLGAHAAGLKDTETGWSEDEDEAAAALQRLCGETSPNKSQARIQPT